MPANQRNIGFVFQNYALFPHLSVAENVAYGLHVRDVASAEVAERVSEVLKLVGLAGYEHQFSSQLSGGEQQRVALARAIVIRPRVLLFDEPLSNLDAKLRVQMRTEIRDLQRRLAITTVYVTHDQEEAMAVSDRIAVMNQGSVVQEGTAEDLYYRPGSEFVATFVGRVNLVPARVTAARRRRRQPSPRSAPCCAPALHAARIGAGARGAARAAPGSDRDRAGDGRAVAGERRVAHVPGREGRVRPALRRRHAPAGGATARRVGSGSPRAPRSACASPTAR